MAFDFKIRETIGNLVSKTCESFLSWMALLNRSSHFLLFDVFGLKMSKFYNFKGLKLFCQILKL